MNIKEIIRTWLIKSPVYNFNLIGRDAWIADQAKTLVEGSVVLDAGAGSCPYRQLFSHCDYKTQDFTGLNDDQLRHGGYGSMDYVCDASEIPVPDNKFDAILCAEVLEHVPDPVKVVMEFGRILRPSGKLMLTVPLGSGIHQEPYHYYGGFTPYWIRQFLGDAGFENIVIEANGGSLKAFSQEAIRFLRMTRPFALEMPLVLGVLWAPVWLVLAPFLGVVIPFACYYLDSFDEEKRFTAGYHVTAIKKSDFCHQ